MRSPVPVTLLATVLGGLLLRHAVAEPVRPDRIHELPTIAQGEWMTYWQRSLDSARADRTALESELAARKMTAPLPAPSGGDFKLTAKRDNVWFAGDEAARLAEAVLSYQTPTGGWSKHTGYSQGPRQPGMQFTSQNEPGQPSHYLGTFDNRATTEEMCFLAAVWHATKREDCRAGFVKGLNYILTAQYPPGGWPQVYPLEGGYHDHITFNDDAMTRILGLLQAIARNEPNFAFLEPSPRQRAMAALEAGTRCVLRTQIVQAGRKTAWCAQYDPLTLQPAAARNMEPVALSGLESAHILQFLMTITNPAPDIVASIEGGLKWLEQVKITGLTKTKRNGRTVYEPNPASTEVYWARFYDVTNSQPVFPGRDGIIYSSYSELAAHNKLGYDYLTTLPGSILNNGQKKWRKMQGSH